MKIRIFAVGKERAGPVNDLISEYARRLTWKLDIREITEDSVDAILEAEKPVILLDERAPSASSEDFARHIEKLQNQGISVLNFLIGGADGFSESQRKKADFLLSFGKQTWPHKLVRVMLVEQIYRAQQILANHPYHRS